MKNKLVVFVCLSFMLVVNGSNFYDQVDISWGDSRAQILDNGNLLNLTLDRISGSGFQSKDEYIFAKIDMQIKLVSRNSAGTVTAYFLSSGGEEHDEINFEFLGNLSGDPYILHTNIYSQGVGSREMQFYLWFDPTSDFHTYTILWNHQLILFYVDGLPIREFKNMESRGISFPQYQPMRMYSSLWEADDWATKGGLVKIDWTQAPFQASYKNLSGNGCVWLDGYSYCSSSSGSWLWAELDEARRGQMKWVQENHMIYNYCKDSTRFPQGFPLECCTT